MSTEEATRVDLAGAGAGPQASLALEFLRAHSAAPRIPAALELGLRLAALPTSLADRWETLATIAASDLGLARAIEPHLDARGILDEAAAAGFALPPDDPAASWGVFASEAPGSSLMATPLGDGSWLLSGGKAWCSLAGSLDRALVTARSVEGERMLFALDLHHPRVWVEDGAWHARGLTEIPSGPIRLDDVPAEPIGAAAWYLERPGFSIGGIGVAACWFGGAVGVARTVFAAAAKSVTPSPFLLMHLGAIDLAIGDARRALVEAASVAGQGASDGSILASRVRGSVARSCEAVIARAGHALGPAPLALDDAHSKRVADLQLYLRQHHAEKDDAALGQSIVDGGVAPW